MPVYAAVLVAIAVGIAAALQPPINTSLAVYVGPVAASTISFVSGALILLVWLLVSLGWSGLSALPAELRGKPLWLFLGGLLGVVVVTGVIYLVPVLGSATAIGVLIAAQMTASLVVDYFGFAGAPVVPVTWVRVLGAALIIAGARLILVRPGS